MGVPLVIIHLRLGFSMEKQAILGVFLWFSYGFPMVWGTPHGPANCTAAVPSRPRGRLLGIQDATVRGEAQEAHAQVPLCTRLDLWNCEDGEIMGICLMRYDLDMDFFMGYIYIYI